MASRAKALQVLCSALAVAALMSCAASTVYHGIPVASLNDEQLVTEIQSAASGLGSEFNRGMYLMAMRPEPAYVLTSSTTSLVDSARGTYNAFVMPTGYGATMTGTVAGTMSGTATTRYQYTDVNAGARLGNAIAAAISRSRQEAYRRRGMEALAEYQNRVTSRRLETGRMIQDFFTQNPDLQARQPLVALVAPWAAAEGLTDGRAILQRTKEIIAGLPRGDGLSGTWYGAFTQTNRSPQGETFTFTEYVKLTLRQQGSVLTGRGTLGSGDNLELTGTVANQDVSAAVANTTSAINVRMTALATPSQMTGSFAGFGPGAQMTGMFTLVR